MGTTTPNIGIYIPAAGETNYDASFGAGMVNLDQHDHSGAPNKGVPIAGSGIADGAITYSKLNANVADTTTGIGTSGSLPNQLVTLGLLKSIYQIPTLAGFIAKNGSAATARTITGTANQINVTNGDGASGDPTLSFPNTFFEEGTWSPTIIGSTGSGTTTYNVQYGVYQRIGNWVECFGYVEVNTTSGMTGRLQIANFPFTSNNNANAYFQGFWDPALMTFTSPTTAGGTYPFTRMIPGTTTSECILYNPTAGEDQFYNAASFSNGDDFAFKIRYLIN